MNTLIKFLGLGAIGFLVDSTARIIFINLLDIDPFSSRLISFSAALATTYALNSRLTFQNRTKSKKQIPLYILASILSASVNLGAYWLIIKNIETVYAPYIGLILGVAAGMISNWVLYNYIVFKRGGYVDIS